MEQRLYLRGVFTFEVFSPWGKLIHFEKVRNGIVTDGITDMFEQYMRGGSGVTPSIGLIDETSFTAVASADTMASHAGWIEIEDYDEATRPTWSPDAAASNQINNSVKAVFTMNVAKNAKGLFLTTSSVKGGTAGKLWSTAIFSLINALQVGQVARAGYSLTGVGA